MRVVYSNERIPRKGKMIFLAGTVSTSRKADWRKYVINKLDSLGFDGIVLNPDYTDIPKQDQNAYNEQILWEIKAAEKADVIMFWIDRDLKKRPGLTTNVEFGYWLHTGKVFYGRPDSSEKCFYLDYIYKMQGNSKPANSLDKLVEEVIRELK